MKLDVTCMRYLGKDHYRMLTAIEMGMRNHELVPVELIISIALLYLISLHESHQGLVFFYRDAIS